MLAPLIFWCHFALCTINWAYSFPPQARYLIISNTITNPSSVMPNEKAPRNDRDTTRDLPREQGGKVTVSKLVYKSQLRKFYGESDYLFNKHFMTKALIEQLNIENYKRRQYFQPDEFQIIVDYHQLSTEEIEEILNHPK